MIAKIGSLARVFSHTHTATGPLKYSVKSEPTRRPVVGVQWHRERLPHLLRRPNSQQFQSGSKDGDDALNQCEARHSQCWITLDNEP